VGSHILEVPLEGKKTPSAGTIGRRVAGGKGGGCFMEGEETDLRKGG